MYDCLRAASPGPARPRHFGAIDIAGFEKDNFYYYKARWSGDPLGNGTGAPVLHILPHWNWDAHAFGSNSNATFPGTVWAHTNADEVELWVNGNSLGRKKLSVVKTVKYNQTTDITQHIEWSGIEYAAGHLEARAYRGGVEVANTSINTAGAPASIELSVDFPLTALRANGQDIALVRATIRDANGLFVPTACDNLISFVASGPGVIVGVGKGLGYLWTKYHTSRGFDSVALLSSWYLSTMVMTMTLVRMTFYLKYFC